MQASAFKVQLKALCPYKTQKAKKVAMPIHRIGHYFSKCECCHGGIAGFPDTVTRYPV